MQMHKQSSQFDPSQYISKKHYKYKKGGAEKRLNLRHNTNEMQKQIDWAVEGMRRLFTKFCDCSQNGERSNDHKQSILIG